MHRCSKSVLTGNSQPSFHRQRLLCSKSSWAIKPETELLPDSLRTLGGGDSTYKSFWVGREFTYPKPLPIVQEGKTKQTQTCQVLSLGPDTNFTPVTVFVTGTVKTHWEFYFYS